MDYNYGQNSNGKTANPKIGRKHMSNPEEVKKILLNHENVLRDTYFVSEMGLFGSLIKKQKKPPRDIDILVEFEDDIDLFMFVNLKNYLTDLLGQNVDLVMKSALKPHIGQHILNEVENVFLNKTTQNPPLLAAARRSQKGTERQSIS